MSTAILGRPQQETRSGVRPSRRDPVAARPTRSERPANRQPSVSAPLARPAVGCAATSGSVREEGGYRMGRWARLGISVSVLAAGCIVAFGGGPSTADSTRDVVTSSGQTLWSVARDSTGTSASAAEVGSQVERLRELNNMTAVGAADALPVGITIHIPTG